MTADASRSGDDSELEELFDSIALAPKPASPTSGDTVELEQLFDSIALAPDHTPSTAVAEPPADEPAFGWMHNGDACPANKVINSVGHLTRQLHDTLAQLGYDQHIQECAAATLPDARQRLAYVVALTEQAASRSLNAVDLATQCRKRSLPMRLH